METIPELIAAVETEMETYRAVLDEYERTLVEVERVLNENTLEAESNLDPGHDVDPIGVD